MSVSIEHEAPLEVLQRYPELLPSLLRDQAGQVLPGNQTQGFDALCWLLNLFGGIVSENRYSEIERMIMLDSDTGWVPRTPFQREHFYKGINKGKAEAVLGVLAARGIAVSEQQQAKLLAVSDNAALDKLIAQAVTVSSAAELLDPL